jgi:hypothetical protein
MSNQILSLKAQWNYLKVKCVTPKLTVESCPITLTSDSHLQWPIHNISTSKSNTHLKLNTAKGKSFISAPSQASKTTSLPIPLHHLSSCLGQTGVSINLDSVLFPISTFNPSVSHGTTTSNIFQMRAFFTISTVPIPLP